MNFILQYKWFIVGAILGVIQLSITIIRGKRVVNAPVLFLTQFILVSIALSQLRESNILNMSIPVSHDFSIKDSIKLSG